MIQMLRATKSKAANRIPQVVEWNRKLPTSIQWGEESGGNIG